MSADEKHHHHHFSAEEKINVVMRSLAGEPLDTLAEELRIPAERIESWELTFLNAGKKALSAPHRKGFRVTGAGSRIVQWSALLLLLLAIVYFLTRFMESSGE